MARSFVAGSSDAVAFTPGWGTLSKNKLSAAISFYWINSGGGGVANRFMQRSDADDGWKWYIAPANALFFELGAAGAGGVWHIALPTANRWTRMLLTLDANAGGAVPIMYLDAVAQTLTTDTGLSGAIGDAGKLYVGNRASANRAWDGSLAEAAVWPDRILTPAEAMVDYIRGPRAVPGGLGFYDDLRGARGIELDQIGGRAGLVTGTKLVAHPLVPPPPRTLRPVRNRLALEAETVPAWAIPAPAAATEWFTRRTRFHTAGAA